jgi:invasion protein IalB
MLFSKSDLTSGAAFRKACLALATAAAFGAVTGAAAIAQTKPAPKDAKEAPAAEAPKDGQDKGAWVKLCQKTPTIEPPAEAKADAKKGDAKPADAKAAAAPETKDVNVCLTHHERIDGNTGRLLVSAALRQIEGQDKEALMIMVPLGMVLPAGVQVKVDEGEPYKLNYLLCHDFGCTAEVEASDAMVAQIKKGKVMAVAAMTLSGKPIIFPIPLVGFDKAYDGQPVDSEKYNEARRRLMGAIRQRIAEARKAQEEKKAGETPAKPAEKK